MTKKAKAGSKSGSEKRRHPRFNLGISMDMHAKGLAVSTGVSGTIIDLSVGGMSFETPAELEEGSSIYLKINIPLEIRGQVRHIRKTGAAHRYGVRFHKIGFGGVDEKKPEKFIAAKFEEPAA